MSIDMDLSVAVATHGDMSQFGSENLSSLLSLLVLILMEISGNLNILGAVNLKI